MGGVDVAHFIRAYDAKLDPARLELKYAAMRRDPFAFFRATCALFHANLPKLGRLMDAPLAWSCGDLHIENFGTFRARNNLIYFDLNDFDEALLAPCIFDPLRATTSIAVARESLGLSRTVERELMEEFVSAYAQALEKGEANWVERDTADGPVGRLVSDLRGRSRSQLLEKRTFRVGKSRKILIDGQHALEAPVSEKMRVGRLIEAWVKRHAEDANIDASFYEVVDVALRIAGLGSLGVERYIILVRGGGEVDQMRLLDLKRARASAAQSSVPNRQPDWASEADRVYWVQLRMQAKNPANLSTLLDRSRSYILRELQPREDRLDLSRVSNQPDGLQSAIRTFGQLAAWAQLRAAGRKGAASAEDLMSFARKEKWRARLLKAAAECAARSHADWEVFCTAYDQQAFRLGSSGPA